MSGRRGIRLVTGARVIAGAVVATGCVLAVVLGAGARFPASRTPLRCRR